MTHEKAIELARKIKVVFSDVDGVFTNNQVLEGASDKGKWRSYYDGQGVSLLRAVGIRVALITNEKDADAKHIVDVVHKWNNLPSSSKIEGDGGWEPVKLFLGMGGSRKLEAAALFLDELNKGREKNQKITLRDCAYIGDDLVDAPLMQKVALRAAPVNADPHIKKICHFISEREGGKGAFRDFANFILESRGIDPLTLPPQ